MSGFELLALIVSNKNGGKSNKNLKAMTWAMKAIGVMTFKEINLTPPLKMGRTTCQWTRGSKHSN
jgi:hypothetical protein